MSEVAFFDLASLAKTLVTTPLAIKFLDLDLDRREQLSLFQSRREQLTVRQLLSHSSGLPPWLPFTPGVSLAAQVQSFRHFGKHVLLKEGVVGTSLYSDLGFRLVADILELERGKSYVDLAAEESASSRFFENAPWSRGGGEHPIHSLPVQLPLGPDIEAWHAADGPLPIALPTDSLPHDTNARSGMRGHAGYGATSSQMKLALDEWVGAGWPRVMSVQVSKTEDNVGWGMGLWKVYNAKGRYGELLRQIPLDLENDRNGAIVIEHVGNELPPSVLEEAAPTADTTDADSDREGWWMHTGFTGPAVFFRPEDNFCIAILCHRRGPAGELLDANYRRGRHYVLLSERFGLQFLF